MCEFKKLRRGLTLSFCLLLGSFSLMVGAKTKIQPNIILIMSDDHGWGDTGFNGNTTVQTPAMDQLVKQGLVFDRFYSGSAVCSPTRASVMTGRNPLRTDVPNANTGHLRNEEITIAELLKEQGYACAHIGKWHLGVLTTTVIDANRGGKEKFADEYTIPSQHGYDAYFSTESKVPTFNPMEYPKVFSEGESKKFGWSAVEDDRLTKSFNTRYWTGADQYVKEEKLQGDDSKLIMDRVLPFIDSSNEKDTPFFTTVWLHAPHLPVVCDSAHRALYPNLDLRTQLYYGAITAMDEQIGRLWQHLQELGIEDETIIFYCSDNGPEVRTPGSAGHFRERKRSLYEGGLRVPAFVVWEGEFKGGNRTSFPAVTSDYLPTIVDLLNIDYPNERPLDGVSLLGAISGKEEERSQPIGFIYQEKISWVDNRYKLISTDLKQSYELYDLLNDPSEEHNIIESHKVIADDMKADLDRWHLSVKNSRKGGDY